LLIDTLIQSDRFDEALAAVDRGRKALGDRPFLFLDEAIGLSEAGSIAAADACFGRVAGWSHILVAVRIVRHQLRNGRLDAAAKLIDQWIRVPDSAPIWPYASITWRLADDARHDWLERQAGLISVVDLADVLPILTGLADLLRNLHHARFQHFDQSVRGGTQTDGALLSRTEPEIRALRSAFVAAIQSHMDGLPPVDPSRPWARR
jgi:hypothetical protein